MADIDFTDTLDDIIADDKSEVVGDNKAADLDNKILIQRLKAKRQKYEDQIAKIDAVITLLRQTPNFSKTYEFLQTILG